MDDVRLHPGSVTIWWIIGGTFMQKLFVQIAFVLWQIIAKGTSSTLALFWEDHGTTKGGILRYTQKNPKSHGMTTFAFGNILIEKAKREEAVIDIRKAAMNRL